LKNRQHDLFLICPPGLEACCVAELGSLGVQGEPRQGGVAFQGGLRELYLVNLWSRCGSRVLVRLGEFRAKDFPGLYRKALQLPWGSYVRPGWPVKLRVTSHRSRLMHSDRIAETVETALRQALGPQESVPGDGEQVVLVRLEEDACTVSIDSSGELLHRRGYRQIMTPAPLRENLAAGMLSLLGWHGDEAFCDPCCGSGTLPIEAALLRSNLAPGMRREFRFMRWPGFRHGLWQQLLSEAARKTVDPGFGIILAADKDESALEAARANARAAGVEELVSFRQEDVAVLEVNPAGGLMAANPPYGLRLDLPLRQLSPLQVVAQRLQADWNRWRCGLLTPERPPGGGWRSAALLHNGGITVNLWAWRAGGE